MAAIDKHVHALDPNWPVVAVDEDPPGTTIFVNPEFMGVSYQLVLAVCFDYLEICMFRSSPNVPLPQQLKTVEKSYFNKQKINVKSRREKWVSLFHRMPQMWYAFTFPMSTVYAMNFHQLL